MLERRSKDIQFVKRTDLNDVEFLKLVKAKLVEESKDVFIVLDVQKAFEFFDDNLDTWVVQGGIYTVSVATSANDIHSQFSVKIDDD